ncbi:hypothetical protein [Oryzobacter terrae]|uniref:hypothetical protein n=1 Tax=Oryzobacter terrae TaxID=1620385 RepID=UPI0036723B0D
MPGGGEVEAAGLRQLAGQLRAVAAGVEVRRASLAPASLTWWQGPGADGYRERMAARRASLAGVADDLREAAHEADVLADRLTARGPSP